MSDPTKTAGLILLACLSAVVLSAQTNETTNSAHQQKLRQYSAKLEEFHKAGRAAYLVEQDHEKSEDCPQAKSTHDLNNCLAKEAGQTSVDYRAYTSALRSVEGLEDDGDSNAVGPTGKPLTAEERLKEFDTVESAWHSYYEAQCLAAFNAYKGGTLAPSMELNCRIQLMRDRMRELENIYQFMH